jgi:glycerophosphoryl diester phosphodiesterase
MVGVDFLTEQFPLVVVHRGAFATFPENTLQAFDAAVAAGAPAVEFDVRLSADGVPVVVHDPDVSRISNGTGFVHELSVGELQSLELTGGGRVATLREVFDLLTGRAGLDIEIKNIPGEPAFDSPKESVLEACLGELEASGFEGPVLVSSFNWLTIERCRELRPDVPTGFLTIGAVDPRAAFVYARDAGHRWVLPNAAPLLAAGDPFVAEVHAAGMLVGTWVVDDREPFAQLLAMGVDAVATNDPELGMAAREEFLAWDRGETFRD